ncbi:MAG: hypothetical protein ABFC67_14715 [Mizugakiibacter sp.]|uniref:hypothetical protein n=1 Tax=Mizugakiibacter sp. TaxID=1972610 RepID=UPI00320F1EA3
MRKRGAHFSGKHHVDPLAAFRSAGRQHPLDDSQTLRLGIVLRTHLEAVRTGKADEYAFHHLGAAVNTSMVMAESSGDDELSAIIGAAQKAIVRLRENGNSKGRWLLDGPGLQALMTWVTHYESQLATVSQQDAMNALDEVTRRVQRGIVF